MIFIFQGEDAFRMMREVKDRIGELESGGFKTVKTFEVSNGDSLEDSIVYLSAEGLWQEKKIVVMNCVAADDAVMRRIEKTAKEKNDFEPHAIFVLLAKDARAPRVISAEYKKFPVLKGNELIAWIREIAERFGNRIDAPAATALMTLHPEDSEGIWNELMIMACWKPGGAITEKDVSTFRSELPSTGDFELIESLLENDKRTALKLLHYDLARGKSPLMILASIVTHFRAMLVAKSGGTDASKKFFAKNHPYWVSKIEHASRQFDIEEIKQAFAKLLKIDRLTKTGEYKPEMLLEEFILFR